MAFVRSSPFLNISDILKHALESLDLSPEIEEAVLKTGFRAAGNLTATELTPRLLPKLLQIFFPKLVLKNPLLFAGSTLLGFGANTFIRSVGEYVSSNADDVSVCVERAATESFQTSIFTLTGMGSALGLKAFFGKNKNFAEKVVGLLGNKAPHIFQEVGMNLSTSLLQVGSQVLSGQPVTSSTLMNTGVMMLSGLGGTARESGLGNSFLSIAGEVLHRFGETWIQNKIEGKEMNWAQVICSLEGVTQRMMGGTLRLGGLSYRPDEIHPAVIQTGRMAKKAGKAVVVATGGAFGLGVGMARKAVDPHEMARDQALESYGRHNVGKKRSLILFDDVLNGLRKTSWRNLLGDQSYYLVLPDWARGSNGDDYCKFKIVPGTGPLLRKASYVKISVSKGKISVLDYSRDPYQRGFRLASCFQETGPIFEVSAWIKSELKKTPKPTLKSVGRLLKELPGQVRNHKLSEVFYFTIYGNRHVMSSVDISHSPNTPHVGPGRKVTTEILIQIKYCVGEDFSLTIEQITGANPRWFNQLGRSGQAMPRRVDVTKTRNGKLGILLDPPTLEGLRAHCDRHKENFLTRWYWATFRQHPKDGEVVSIFGYGHNNTNWREGKIPGGSLILDRGLRGEDPLFYVPVFHVAFKNKRWAMMPGKSWSGAQVKRYIDLLLQHGCIKPNTLYDGAIPIESEVVIPPSSQPSRPKSSLAKGPALSQPQATLPERCTTVAMGFDGDSNTLTAKESEVAKPSSQPSRPKQSSTRGPTLTRPQATLPERHTTWAQAFKGDRSLIDRMGALEERSSGLTSPLARHLMDADLKIAYGGRFGISAHLASRLEEKAEVYAYYDHLKSECSGVASDVFTRALSEATDRRNRGAQNTLLEMVQEYLEKLK